MSQDFSNLSAICPARAEKIKNGRIKTPAARFTSKPLFSPALATAENAINATSAFLKMLSLKAPSNWVKKNGANRFWVRRLNWECCMTTLLTSIN